MFAVFVFCFFVQLHNCYKFVAPIILPATSRQTGKCSGPAQLKWWKFSPPLESMTLCPSMYQERTALQEHKTNTDPRAQREHAHRQAKKTRCGWEFAVVKKTIKEKGNSKVKQLIEILREPEKEHNSATNEDDFLMLPYNSFTSPAAVPISTSLPTDALSSLLDYR